MDVEGLLTLGFRFSQVFLPLAILKKNLSFFLKGKNKYIPAEGLRKTTLLYSLIL